MMYRNDYLLVKVGLNVDQYHWFGLSSAEGEDKTSKKKRTGRWLMHMGNFSGTKEAGKRAYRDEKDEAGKRAYREEKDETGKRAYREEKDETGNEKMIDSMNQCVEVILGRLQELDQYFELYTVYGYRLGCLKEKVPEEGKADSRIKPQKRLKTAILWQQCWNISEFHDYLNFRFMECLLQDITQNDFLILGVEDVIPKVIEKLARKMKHVRWITGVEESDWVQYVADEFEEEYGLIIETEFIEDGPGRKNSFMKLNAMDEKPVCILDFTKKDVSFYGGPESGSCWIDFYSSEEKYIRLSRYEHDIQYISLKSYWDRCTRRKAIVNFRREW